MHCSDAFVFIAIAATTLDINGNLIQGKIFIDRWICSWKVAAFRIPPLRAQVSRVSRGVKPQKEIGRGRFDTLNYTLIIRLPHLGRIAL